jgi:hypothetical protein
MDPPSEFVDDSVSIAPVAAAGNDGTQLWKITHNGVDTHPVHFHLFNVQLINRVDWAGVVKPPEDNELGWKETVRMNPLEDCIVALRPASPKSPFGVPDSVRYLDPTMPPGWAGFKNVDPLTGNPVTITNEIRNFGWEYMWHCHILSHEEMDMMRPIVFNVARRTPRLRPRPIPPRATPGATPTAKSASASSDRTTMVRSRRSRRRPPTKPPTRTRRSTPWWAISTASSPSTPPAKRRRTP